MAIFGNFKGTTKSEFQIGKSGAKISTGTAPSSDLSVGDLFVDSSNATLQVYNNAWVNIGSTLPELNVDDGTLFVDSANDTVSVGSTASNEKLFVNGSLRLGTNPAIKYSGAYVDVQHSNGTATQIRVRDNTSGSDPIFKIYDANNENEVFKVQGSTTTIGGNIALEPGGTIGTISDSALIKFKENSTIYSGVNLSMGSIEGAHILLDMNGGSPNSATFSVRTGNTTIDSSTELFSIDGTGVTINEAYTLPTADGTDGQVLTTDGSGALSFTSVSASPGGSNTQIQYNSDGSFAGTDAFTFDEATSTLETGVVRGVIFEPITDYGDIAESANMNIDFGNVSQPATVGDFEYLNDTYGPTADSFTVAGLPSAAQPGQMIYVSDETGGPVMAFSDGTTWRRITDRAVVS